MVSLDEVRASNVALKSYGPGLVGVFGIFYKLGTLLAE